MIDGVHVRAVSWQAVARLGHPYCTEVERQIQWRLKLLNRAVDDHR
jgi:hypothetical protein